MLQNHTISCNFYKGDHLGFSSKSTINLCSVALCYTLPISLALNITKEGNYFQLLRTYFLIPPQIDVVSLLMPHIDMYLH